MNSSSTSISLDFPKQITRMAIDSFNEGEKHAYRLIWEYIKYLTVEHWIWILVGLVCLFLLAFLEYIITRRWAFLGSVLYHYFYLGFLLVLTLVFGPEIYASEWAKIILFVIYIICYVLVGKLLTKIGIQK